MSVIYCQLGNAITLFLGGINILYLWCNFHNHCTYCHCVYVGRKPKGIIFRILKVGTQLTQIIFRSRMNNDPEWSISNFCPLAPGTAKKPKKFLLGWMNRMAAYEKCEVLIIRSQLKFCAQFLSSCFQKSYGLTEESQKDF